jgi:hypothetical protein
MTDAVVRIGRLISTSNLIFEIPAQDVSPAHVNNACSRRALRAAQFFRISRCPFGTVRSRHRRQHELRVDRPS